MIEEIYKEIETVLKEVDEQDLHKAKDLIQREGRVYVTAAGRNLLQGRAFVMRLMHIGYEVYVVGETNTPAIKSTDVLVAISGSGNTGQVVYVVNKAKAAGAKVISVLSKKDSEMGKASDQIIIIPAATRDSDKVGSIQLLSTLFDQSVHIVLDTLALMLAKRDGIDNSYAKKMHSNLE